jgi:hypothetical protein
MLVTKIGDPQTVVFINGQEIKDYIFASGIFKTRYPAKASPARSSRIPICLVVINHSGHSKVYWKLLYLHMLLHLPLSVLL